MEVKNKKIIILLVIILIVLILSIMIVPKFTGYKFSSRINKMNEYKEKQSNLGVVGWLRVQGTDIDYPIINNSDKLEYDDGEIQYLWENGSMDKLNRINYIMGHNIMNLSANPLIAEKGHVRFEQLLSFTYLDFVEKNKYIQLTVNNKDYVFKIFSVSYPKAFEVSTYNSEYRNNDDVLELIEKSLEESIFNFDIDVDENDTIISLITCTRMFNSSDRRDFRVDARLLRENESTRNYKVTKTKKFSEIEKQMKGAKKVNEKA